MKKRWTTNPGRSWLPAIPRITQTARVLIRWNASSRWHWWRLWRSGNAPKAPTTTNFVSESNKHHNDTASDPTYLHTGLLNAEELSFSEIWYLPISIDLFCEGSTYQAKATHIEELSKIQRTSWTWRQPNPRNLWTRTRAHRFLTSQFHSLLLSFRGEICFWDANPTKVDSA